MNEKIEYLMTADGEILTTREEILEYLKQVRRILKEIRRTPKFASDFRQGNLSEYYQLENSLKLRNKNNEQMNDDEILEWLEKSKIK